MLHRGGGAGQTRQLPDQYLHKSLLENENLCFFVPTNMFNLPDQSPTASSTSECNVGSYI